MRTESIDRTSRSVTMRPLSSETAGLNVSISSINTKHRYNEETNTDNPTFEPPNYRPWLMGTWTLCFWCILPLVSIGLIEYAHQTSLRGRGLFKKGPKYETRELVLPFLPEFLSNFLLIVSGLFFFELDRAVKKMEPFYQMSQPGGATGWTCLCVDYFRPFILLIPYLAIKNRHWTILCTSMALILDTIVILQLVPRIFIYDDEVKELRMDPVYKYSLQGVLLFASALMGILAIILHRRKSGVLRNLDDFGHLIRLTRLSSPENSIQHLFERLEIDLDDEICEEELERKLGPLRFKLQAQYLGDEEPQFSIIVLNGEGKPPLDQEVRIQSVSSTAASSSWGGSLRRVYNACTCTCTRLRRRLLWKDNHPWLFQKIPLSIILFIYIVLFIVLTGQPFWARSGGFPQTFGASSSGHITLKVIFSIFISSFWMQAARYLAEYEYVYLMGRKGGAPYGHTRTDLSFVAWPLRDLWQGIKGIYRNGYDDVSNYVELNTVLAIYASYIHLFAWISLSNETYDSWSTKIVCVSIMIPCEVIMISAILLLLYCRSRPILPRQPITLASKLVMVYATNIIRADSIPDLEEAETPQASEAVTQPPQSFQGSLNPGENSETATQEINATDITAIPSTELPNPPTSLSTVDNSPQISQRWWNLRSRKDKSKGKRIRSWLDLAEPGDPGVCAFGYFEGRDGKKHVGIGKHGAGMTEYIEYTISKERQKKIDEGSTYKSIAGTA